MFENYDNLDEILHPSQIITDPINPTHGKNVPKILINSLSRCVSIHDLKPKYNEKDVCNFIEKYKKRFNRIINHVKGTDKIIFVRHGNIDTVQKNRFIKAIKLINPECDFWFAYVNPNQNTNKIIKEDHFLTINMTEKTPIPVFNTEVWNLSYLNWSTIFSIVDEMV